MDTRTYVSFFLGGASEALGVRAKTKGSVSRASKPQGFAPPALFLVSFYEARARGMP